MLTIRKTVTRWVVLAIVGWSFLMYLLWGTWREPYAGWIVCPDGTPYCHDAEPPPFAPWWVVGLLVALVVAWVVGLLRVRRA